MATQTNNTVVLEFDKKNKTEQQVAHPPLLCCVCVMGLTVLYLVLDCNGKQPKLGQSS